MGENEAARLIAWHRELLAVHARLREALAVARSSVDEASGAHDLLLFCTGFCVALDGHHRSEDRALFPELARRHPSLRPTLEKLTQDHSMLAHLMQQLQHALGSAEAPALHRHLDGIAAIMDSHFGYEERQLLDVLAALDLDADRDLMLGPL